MFVICTRKNWLAHTPPKIKSATQSKNWFDEQLTLHNLFPRLFCADARMSNSSTFYTPKVCAEIVFFLTFCPFRFFRGETTLYHLIPLLFCVGAYVENVHRTKTWKNQTNRHFHAYTQLIMHGAFSIYRHVISTEIWSMFDAHFMDVNTSPVSSPQPFRSFPGLFFIQTAHKLQDIFLSLHWWNCMEIESQAHTMLWEMLSKMHIGQMLKRFF